MNVEKTRDNSDSKKIITLIVLIATVMVMTTGATYAYFQISATNATTMTGTAATASLSLAVTRETPDTTKWDGSTKVMVPQLNAAIGTAMNGTNKCVDGNNNVVCEVFKIVVTNNSTSGVRLRGAIYFTVTDGSFSNLYWRQTTNANTVGNNTIFKASIPAGTSATQITAAEQANSTTANAVNATLVADQYLAPSGSQTYYVVVWISETGSNQNTTDTGTWTATVSFKDKVNPDKGITSTITS